MKRKAYVGMDVHKDSITIAVLYKGKSEKENLSTIPNEEADIKRFFGKLQKEVQSIESCYEAGVTGFPLYRFLTGMGIECKIVAPGKLPRKTSDRIKTDARDAVKLVRLLKNEEVESIRVPSKEEEALRDFIRGRDDLRLDLGRNKQRIMKFLLRKGYKYSGAKYWTGNHLKWLGNISFDDPLVQETYSNYLRQIHFQMANLKTIDKGIQDIAETDPYKERVSILRSFKGIDYLTAMFLISEIGDFRRFPTAGSFMSFLGLVPGEYSSGAKKKRTGITKSGSALLRRILVEASWHQRWPGSGGKRLLERREGQAPEVIAIAEKAGLRLHRKYKKMLERGKSPQVTITAVSREFAGFIWSAMKDVA